MAQCLRSSKASLKCLMIVKTLQNEHKRHDGVDKWKCKIRTLQFT